MTQTMQWIGYCVLVSAALALGAMALESAARSTGRAGRWGWVAALFGSVLLPLVSYLRPVHITASSLPISMAPADFSAVTAPLQSASSSLPLINGTMLWAAASLLVVACIAVSYVRLVRARRTWTRAQVNEETVWVSRDIGPAALGVVRADIVLPRWVLALERRAIGLMLLHEREHLRAWDPRVMLASLLIVAIMPWNPVAWFMVRRLRLAMELDCDARVLARDPDPAAYGAVLLEVGRHRASGRLALSTFAEPRSQLEQRIRRMAEWPGHKRFARALTLAALALLLTGGAYAVKGPLHANVIVDAAETATDAAGDVATGIADTIPPMLRNGEDVQRSLNRNYPPLLRDAGIEGVAGVYAVVGTNGRMVSPVIAHSSGYPAIDSAALRVARDMQFTPAVHAGRRVSIGVNVMLRFGMRLSATVASTIEPMDPPPPPPPPLAPPTPGAPASVIPTPARPGMVTRVDVTPTVDTIIRLPRATQGDISARPLFTPMTVSPRLRNGPEVQSAVSKVYPPLLREAGIGGKTKIWVFIDETGRAAKWVVNTTSGYDALDRAAMKVAPVMKFTPAQNQDVIVPVWVALDIVFRADGPDIEVAPLMVPQPRPPQPPPAQDARGVPIPPTHTRLEEPPVYEPEAWTRERLMSEPVFTPMTTQPRLVNAPEVTSVIARAYPRLLRDAGISGKTKVWFFIDETGKVQNWRVNTTSGYDAMDNAALKVAPVLAFTPATNQGKVVPVWVAIDIVFSVK